MLSQLAKLSRWDKPVGTLLLYIPCQWGLFASNSNELLKYSTLFAIGSVAMRGAGCTINDIWDYKFDRRVERTKDRPLAGGHISMKNAVLWSGAQSLVGLGVLLNLPFQAQVVALSSVPLVIIYPYMKRVTHYPQAMLGLAFNYGVLVGYSTNLMLDIPSALLYASGWCWTLVYDTIYAHQDKVDDAKIGVRSTALRFGNNKNPLYAFTIAQYGLLCLLPGGTFTYLSGAVAFAFQMSLIRGVDLNNSSSCKSGFNKSIWSGAIIALGLLLDRLQRREEKVYQ